MLKREIQNTSPFHTQATLTITLKCDTQYYQLRRYVGLFLPGSYLFPVLPKYHYPSQSNLSLFKSQGTRSRCHSLLFELTIELKNQID